MKRGEELFTGWVPTCRVAASFNNAISVLRRAFKFGYRDHPDKHDPSRGLRSARIRKKDRPIIDPFTIHEAEALIAAIHRHWGEAQGNHDEFRFFTGLRPSEQIALVVDDFDALRGTLGVTKARVGGIDKDSTKTGQDRRIVLCPRALAVLKRQLALRAELERAGKISHDHVVLQGEWRADPESSIPVYALAPDIRAPPEHSLSQAVLRPPLLYELGSDDGPKRAVGRSSV